jgi:drug/metabolite transporter (DMT)-like permease
MAAGLGALSGGSGVSRGFSLLILLACACLEAGGDALVRRGMYSGSAAMRGTLYVAGALILFAYGWLVNRPPWSFGSVLGVYVVLFFVIAQLVSWILFGEWPGIHVMVGGALIITGGLVVASGA